MQTKTITCIICPSGCSITITSDGTNIKEISGNGCKRGESYAQSEITTPVRTVTTTVRVKNGQSFVVPVKTRTPIPKNSVFACLSCLKNTYAEAPIHIGDIILPDAAGTGVDVIATKDVEKVVHEFPKS